MTVLESIVYLVIVSLLWGVTNPLLKNGAAGVNDVESSSKYGKILKEIYFLVTNVKYMIPFLVNQCGSLLYVATLRGVDLSLAVPVTNSLAFVATAITGWILGEEKPHRNICMGMFLIVLGTTICCLDKVSSDKTS